MDQDICKNCECPSHCTGGKCSRCYDAGEECTTCDCVNCDGSKTIDK